MGLFDFFRRKPDKSPVEDLVTPPVDMPEARCHHYFFAHHALRSLAFQNPMGFLGVLASDDARPFLQDVLKSVTEHCRKLEPKSDFAVEEVIVHKTRIGFSPCVVIEMPPALGVTEAIFIAAVLMVDLDRKPPPLDTLRYFTLEVGITLDGPPRTVLCEWTADGTHLNFGDGPEAELERFVKAVQDLILKR